MPAYIVADSDSLANRIRDVLKFGGQDCPASNVVPIDDAPKRLGREASVDLVILAMPGERERGLAILPPLARIAPGKILVVGPTTDHKLVLGALRNGAADFVDSAELEVELEAAIRRLAAASVGPAEPGRLIAVLAPNGGSGSSTLAANIAVSLAKEHKAIGLIDLKLESGDLAALLDVRPTFTLGDLGRNASRLDRVMFERSLVKHSSGVQLLAPPLQLADILQIKPAVVSQAIDIARSIFPYVVADLDHNYREEQAMTLIQADIILVVFRLDFISLRNVRRTLEYLEKMEIPADKVRLVVNRFGQSQEVPTGKAEEALGRKIAHFVPEDSKAINRASNHGIPVVIDAPSAKVAKSMSQLAMSVNGQHKK